MRTYIYYIGIALLACVAEGWAREVPEGRVAIDGAELRATDDSIHVRMRIDLSDLELSANRSVMLWPWLRIEADSTRLPGVAVMGRRQYIYAQRNAEAVPAGTRVTRRVNGRTVRDRRIRYFTVRGHYSMGFDDVLVSASDKIDGKSMSGLRSFDTNASREYTQEYLSGYSASQYTRDGLTCWEDAKNIMRGRVRAAVLSGYSYDVVSSFNLSMRCSDITYKYLLIPIYVGHCSWRKKLYNFFVNGVNGAVTGKAPTSPLKVTGLVVLGIAVIVGLYFLFRWFNG